MANVTLIQPPYLYPETAMKLRSASPPLGLAYIAGALQGANHSIHIIDSVGLRINTRRQTEFEGHYATGLTTAEILALIPENTHIIGISAMFATDWMNTKVIAIQIRKKFPKVILMLGGEQVSSEPDHSLISTGADLVVIGEGEETAVEIANRFHSGESLRDIQGTYFHDRINNEIVRNPRRKRVRNIDEIPRPAWELFPIASYLDKSIGTTAWDKSKISMLMSRGCPYQCSFCSSPNMWGTNWFPRNAYLDCEHFNFIHDSAVSGFKVLEYKPAFLSWYQVWKILHLPLGQVFTTEYIKPASFINTITPSSKNKLSPYAWIKIKTRTSFYPASEVESISHTEVELELPWVMKPLLAFIEYEMKKLKVLIDLEDVAMLERKRAVFGKLTPAHFLHPEQFILFKEEYMNAFSGEVNLPEAPELLKKRKLQNLVDLKHPYVKKFLKTRFREIAQMDFISASV